MSETARSERRYPNKYVRAGLAAALLASAAMGVVGESTTPSATKGSCTRVEMGGSWPWKLEGTKGAYLEVTAAQVRSFMGHNPDSVDFTKMPHGDELKVLENPADVHNNNIATTIQKGVFRETVAIDSIDDKSIVTDSTVQKGAIRVEAFTGNCGFNVPQ